MSSGQQFVQLAQGPKKPVMRVSPLVDGQKRTNGDGSVFTEGVLHIVISIGFISYNLNIAKKVKQANFTLKMYVLL